MIRAIEICPIEIHKLVGHAELCSDPLCSAMAFRIEGSGHPTVVSRPARTPARPARASSARLGRQVCKCSREAAAVISTSGKLDGRGDRARVKERGGAAAGFCLACNETPIARGREGGGDAAVA